MNQQPSQGKVLAILITLLLVANSWAATPTSVPQLPDPGSTGMTKEQQEGLGRQAMAEVYKQMPVLSDSSPQTQYIRQVGKRLTDVIPQENSWPFEFHVIPQKDINAFALPGGPMFVNVGAIVAAENEAELAGVMAHEMAHVYMQHSAKQASKAQWTGLLGALGGLFGNSTIGSLARAGVQFGAGTLMMKYSRSDEAQADAVGAVIMYKAGYDPSAFANFFEKLEKEGGDGGPQFLSDHPNPGNRQEAINKQVSAWPSKKYAADNQGFVRAKEEASRVKIFSGQEIADGAKQGRWARQNKQNGVIPANLPTFPEETAADMPSSIGFPEIQPSREAKQLQHSAFTMSYPANWRVSGDQRSSVTIAPAAGVGERAIAYGVVVGGAQEQSAGTLDEATADLVQTLQRSNPGLRVSGSLQPIRVNGQSGRSVSLVGASPLRQDGQTLRERDWLVTVARPQGGILYLVFIAPERDFGQLQPTYGRMLDSLQLQ
jgi:beta-barrel assembly-enhancing protease